MADEIKPVEPQITQPPVVAEIPTTKEGWNNLANTDPKKFAELTQTRMDKVYREAKEAKERADALEAQNRNILAELNAFKQPVTPTYTPEQEKVYGGGEYPQTESEWNDLFIERPVFANDLRNEYLNRTRAVQSDFENTRANARKKVQTDHQDMYIYELDETGKPRKDAQGKNVLKIDPAQGEPIFNPESEKGKLWVQIWEEDPQGWNSLKNAPQLMMAEMERRLRAKGANMVKGQNNDVDIDHSGVAPEGVPPPRSISLKFGSDEEKAHAERAVSRGTYKSLDEYVKLRDEGDKGYAEANRRPDFSKR